ncbi:MAG: hypothetical protein ACK40V_06830, partial [Anaerolineales bacterium]
VESKPQAMDTPSAVAQPQDEEPLLAENLPSPPKVESIPDDRNITAPGDRVLLIVEDDASFATVLAGQAREKGFNIKVGRFPFQANGKALGLGDYAGFVKIIMDEKYGEILGAHMIGPEVTELLPELTLARMMELTPHEIARNVHAHPTLSEVLMEAAHGADGQPIHI